MNSGEFEVLAKNLMEMRRKADDYDRLMQDNKELEAKYQYWKEEWKETEALLLSKQEENKTLRADFTKVALAGNETQAVLDRIVEPLGSKDLAFARHFCVDIRLTHEDCQCHTETASLYVYADAISSIVEIICDYLDTQRPSEKPTVEDRLRVVLESCVDCDDMEFVVTGLISEFDLRG